MSWWETAFVLDETVFAVTQSGCGCVDVIKGRVKRISLSYGGDGNVETVYYIEYLCDGYANVSKIAGDDVYGSIEELLRRIEKELGSGGAA